MSNEEDCEKGTNIAANAPIGFVCSECNCSNGTGGAKLSYTGFPYTEPFRFCPGCGVQMITEE